MNLAAMRARVRRPFKWLDTDTECTTLVDDALNDAYDWVNARRRWRGLKATDSTLTITEAAPTEDAPSGWRAFTSVFIINSAGSGKQLEYITWDKCFNDYGDPEELTAGTPGFYTIKSAADGSLGARKLVIVPIPYPNDTFTLRLNGIYRPARLSAATDVPWFDESFHVILPQHAIATLGLVEAGWDRDKCDRYMQVAIERVEAMADDEPGGETATSVVPLIGE